MIRKMILAVIISGGLLAQTDTEKQFLCGQAKSFSKILARGLTPTVEQQKIDALYYGINLEIDPLTSTITGSVTGRFRLIQLPLNSIDLDFADNMTISNLTVNGLAANYERSDNLLQISVPVGLAVDDQFSVTVHYSGQPQPTGFLSFVFSEHNEQPWISTLSEPYGARTWWPCKDEPSDKADSVDITITVPQDLIVASNGKLVKTTTSGSTKTYFWQERYPIVTYLVSLAIHPYYFWQDQYISAANDTMPIEFYVRPDYYTLVQNNYMKTRSMIEFFSEVFGEYPFIKEKYGHAEFDWGGGMEHQTLTSLGGYGEDLIVHELAHQWWGDMITCASFHHIWLNEGFATYAEALWWEHTSGAAAYHEDMTRNEYFGDGTIYVGNPNSTSVIFNSGLSYRKASWVLHMLRHVVGDTTFFEILKAYANDPDLKFGTVTTDSFHSLCEEVSGLNLNDFFQQWIYGSHFPVYGVSWEQRSDSLLVTVDQEQKTGTFFHLPVDLKIVCGDSAFTRVVDNQKSDDLFTIIIPSGREVDSVILDPDNWILKNVNYYDLGHPDGLPDQYILRPAYPNPFNSMLTIPFQVPLRGTVELSIIDLQGRRVNSFEGFYEPGDHFVIWNGLDRSQHQVASGIYLIRLSAPESFMTEKVILLK